MATCPPRPSTVRNGLITCPASWNADTATWTTRDFDFRFVDRSQDGAYLVLARLRQANTYLNWSYQKFLRGTVEVVDTSAPLPWRRSARAPWPTTVPKSLWPLGKRYMYIDFDSNRIQLSARYNGERNGIGKVVEAPSPDSALPAVALPFRFPWVGQDPAAGGEGSGPMAGLRGALGFGKASPPHFQVEAYAPWRGTVALSDGSGNMYVFNPATGGYCLSNFREWWNPRRKIHQPPLGPPVDPRRPDPAAASPLKAVTASPALAAPEARVP